MTLGGYGRDLHPMVVHFPIALLLTGLTCEAVAAVWPNTGLARVAMVLLALGFAGALVAVLTGLENPVAAAVRSTLANTPPSDPGVRAVYLDRLAHIRVHQRFAYGTLAAGAVALLVRLWRRRGTGWTVASLVSGLALAVLVALTGFTGGRLAQ